MLHQIDIINSFKLLFLRIHFLNHDHLNNNEHFLVKDLISVILRRQGLTENEEKAARSDLLNQFKCWHSEYKDNVKTVAAKVKQPYIDEEYILLISLYY